MHPLDDRLEPYVSPCGGKVEFLTRVQIATSHIGWVKVGEEQTRRTDDPGQLGSDDGADRHVADRGAGSIDETEQGEA